MIVGVVVVVALVAAAAGYLAARSAGRPDRELAARVPDLERRVSDQQAVADAAGEAQDRLTRALEAIPQGVVICDAEGEVVFRNPAASEFFAARHSDALVEAAIDELIRAAVSGQADQRSLELYGPPRRALDLVAVPLDDGRGGALIVVEDVSERRRLDAVRRDFVANISHELKTPIGAIGVLAETVASEDDLATARRLAERMQTESFRLARTVDDLLELSRIEAREAPVRDPVDVDLVVAEAVDRNRPSAELRRIRIVAPPGQGLTVLGDRRQLVSALSNLVDNAVKYSDAGSEVRLGAEQRGDRVRLSVTDRGIGIPAGDLERVFERFYRVDRARSRETGGTGLGLAIVRHVAGNHDGEVTVESREGEGSTFALLLPAGPVHPDAPSDPPDEAEPRPAPAPPTALEAP